MKNTLLKILRNQKVIINEIYEFKSGKYTHTKEVMANEKPRYSFINSNDRWEEHTPLTNNEFKEIEQFLKIENSYIAIGNNENDLFITEYIFK